MVFDPLISFGSWRKRRSASSPQTVGKRSVGCSGKTVACLTEICVIERSAVGAVTSGSLRVCGYLALSATRLCTSGQRGKVFRENGL